MPVKLNSYLLSDNVINIMRNELEKTKLVKKELGFNLCKIEASEELIDDVHCMGLIAN
jgi:hypothetical protein